MFIRKLHAEQYFGIRDMCRVRDTGDMDRNVCMVTVSKMLWSELG